MRDKMFSEFKAPEIEPKQDFISELSSIAKNNSPLSSTRQKAKKPFAWRQMGVALAMSGALAFVGFNFIFSPENNSSPYVSSAPNASQESQGFEKDSGYTSRYDGENSPQTAPETEVCQFKLSAVVEYIQCVIRNNSG